METVQKKPSSFTDHMRIRFKGVFDPIGAFLNKLGISPNTMTMLGLLGNIVGAFFLAKGEMFMGGLLIVICTPFDALDGTMARLKGEVSEFGAFLDSVTDRYSELFVLGELLFYFTLRGDATTTVGIYVAAAGSVLVSYVKARAESLKFDANVGILTRVERYLVIAPLLLLNQPQLAIWIIAVLANVTAFQRIWKVRQQAYKPIKTLKTNRRFPHEFYVRRYPYYNVWGRFCSLLLWHHSNDRHNGRRVAGITRNGASRP
jgi:CDP-diacylglycerol--glycerol-3-phosphate 3-phosphatidyltransferase